MGIGITIVLVRTDNLTNQRQWQALTRMREGATFFPIRGSRDPHLGPSRGLWGRRKEGNLFTGPLKKKDLTKNWTKIATKNALKRPTRSSPYLKMTMATLGFYLRRFGNFMHLYEKMRAFRVIIKNLPFIFEIPSIHREMRVNLSRRMHVGVHNICKEPS